MSESLVDPEPSPEDSGHGLHDSGWTDDEWRLLMENLVESGVITWREATACILGELNPPQVGTSVASADAGKFGFKENHQSQHPDESFMPHVLDWFYSQSGRCLDCGTRLDLQADHQEGRENFDNPRQADWLHNLCLRCRRHNVAKRKSHEARAGRTELPAQQGLMWILFVLRPLTLRDFMRLARLYGMSMASIRFDEAWAMAIWMEREGGYLIDRSEGRYSLLRWPTGRVTRTPDEEIDGPVSDGAEILDTGLTRGDVACFLTADGHGEFRYTEFPLADLPFTYNLGDISPGEVSFWPGTSQERMSDYEPIPPSGDLVGFCVRSEAQISTLVRDGRDSSTFEPRASGTAFYKGKLYRLPPMDGAVLEPRPIEADH